MIRAVQTEADAREFAARIHGQFYFRSAMGMRLALFGQKPSSGWRFCLTDSGALMLRGASAQLCGACRDDAEGEEVAAFLHFSGVETLLCREEDRMLPGWGEPRQRVGFCLPKGKSLTGKPALEDADAFPGAPPAGMQLDVSPSMWEISRLLFDDQEEQERFYSDSCTAAAHGMGCTWALRAPDGALVTTVSCCADFDGEAYVAAGMTAPDWRGRELGAWLIAAMLSNKARTADAVLLCEPALCGFYERMGLHRGPAFALYRPVP